MSFEECVIYCAHDRELVVEFDRLYGTNIGKLGLRSGIERMVDRATSYEADCCRKFIAFVWNCVWTRLPEEYFMDPPETAGSRHP